MAAIDVHTHAFPDSIAERAVSSLEAGADWKAVSRGTVNELLQSMDAADVDVSVICTIATKPDQPAGIVKWCNKIRSDRIEPLPSVHPDTPDAVKWVRRFADEGFVGIKLHPMYQEFAFDDERMSDVLAAAEELGLLVEVHCGRDTAYPADDDRAAPRRIRTVIDRHPNLRLVATHMGGWRDWDAAEQFVIGTNVYLETSFSLHDLPRERVAAMIRRHGVDRVLWGTDWPWAAQDAELRALGSLGLSETEIHKILWTNAAKMLGC